MPIVLKTGEIAIKNRETGQYYKTLNAVAEQTIDEVVSAATGEVREEGEAQVNAVTAAGATAEANFPVTADACETLSLDFAKPYVGNKAYNAGDYCTNQYVLYRAVVDIPADQDASFVASHWAEVSFRDESNSIFKAINDINNTRIIRFIPDHYIKSNSNVTLAVLLSPAGYSCAVVDCQEGDKFTINGTGGSAGRLWCFVDSNNTILSNAGSNATLVNGVITAPENASKLILNGNASGITAVFGEFIGNSVAEINSKLNNLTNDLIGLKNNYSSVTVEFDSKKNIDTDYYVYPGEKYYVQIESASESLEGHYINVIFVGGSGVYCSLSNVGDSASRTSTQYGKLRLYNPTTYIGSVTIKIWSELENYVKTLDNTLLKKYLNIKGGVITTISGLKSFIGNTSEEYEPTADDFPENTVCYISGACPSFENMANINGHTGGNYITIQPSSPGTATGRTQIFFGYYGGIAFRYSTPDGYRSWYYTKSSVRTYRVGATRTYKNLIELLLALNASKDGQGNWVLDAAGNIHWDYDTEEKIIYIDPGVYDIYQAYRDNNVPSPPSETSTGSYKPWCVSVPSNTTIIGLGNVTFQWDPLDDDITSDEANIWSCLDIYGDEIHIENITILANNCRYCIHDDPHNNFPGCHHTYKNINMLRETHSKGFNIVGGFGLCDNGRYEFENVHAENNNGSNSLHCLGGHEGNTGSSAGTYNGATVTYNNCVLLTEGNNSIRFQTINSSEAQQRIQVSINNCYLNKRLYLDKYSSSSNQFFDVTMLNSCASDIIVEHTSNPYPVKQYNCHIGT